MHNFLDMTFRNVFAELEVEYLISLKKDPADPLFQCLAEHQTLTQEVDNSSGSGNNVYFLNQSLNCEANSCFPGPCLLIWPGTLTEGR